MPLIQKRISQMGFGKQSGKDSAAANPTYAFGLKAGRVAMVELTQDPDELTYSSGRVTPHGIRTQAVPAAEVTSRVWPKSIPAALYAALGAISTTGPVSTIYTHTITPADDLPYYGVFGRLGGNYLRLDNGLLDELTLSWDRANPLEGALRFLGTDLTFLGSSWTATTDDTLNDYFRPVGGTLKVDVDSATAVAASIAGGSIRIANGVGPVQLATSVLPDDVFPGEQVMEVTLTVVVSDLNMWREAILGAAGNTTINEKPVFGSFDVKFVEGTNELQLAATRVMFAIEFPESDPAGGPVELELVGRVLKPSGAALTATVKNDVASY